jgi:hypothetical protein
MKNKIILYCFLLLFLTTSGSTQQMDDEYSWKAASLEKFSKFVKWPKETDQNDKSQPFVIGIIGENPFGKILDIAYNEQSYRIKDKKVKIKYIKANNPDEIPGCHILFISSSCKNNLSEILAITRDKPILTIADTKGYAEKGVLINFFISKRKIRFEINEELFHKASLKVDIRLLRMAKIVRNR